MKDRLILTLSSDRQKNIGDFALKESSHFDLFLILLLFDNQGKNAFLKIREHLVYRLINLVLLDVLSSPDQICHKLDISS